MIDIIQQRLDRYAANTPDEQEHAFKEIIQEIALYALWRADFFEVAAFQGGTSLRILHGLPRFSEDLDFILVTPTTDFDWTTYRDALQTVLAEFGIESEFVPQGRMDRAIRTAVIKDNSIANQLNLAFHRGHPDKKLKVKLEIDINPPAGSGYGFSYLDFPADFEVRHQDLESNFALKIHALLCRPHLKGRDWYDFAWYVAQGVSPRPELLRNALVQVGPWVGQEELVVDSAWLNEALTDRIHSIDWNQASQDVAPFLRAIEQESLKLWSERFFLHKLAKLQSTRTPDRRT